MLFSSCYKTLFYRITYISALQRDFLVSEEGRFFQKCSFSLQKYKKIRQKENFLTIRDKLPAAKNRVER